LELSPGSGGCGSGGASSCRHVRSSRRRLRDHDAISPTGGAASTTRRRRETSHSTTLSTPRCQGGWRQLEYTRVIISPSAHPRTAGPARRGPTARARTGFDPHSPEVTSFADGEPAKIHPGLQGPRSRFGQAQSKAQTHSCTQGMAGRRDPPGHSCCLGTGPTTHNPHISRGTPRAAGRRKNPGIQVARASACHARPTTLHSRDGGPASKALGQYRPDHSTSHGPTTIVPKGQGLK
jgi:hypothetical protein